MIFYCAYNLFEQWWLNLGWDGAERKVIWMHPLALMSTGAMLFSDCHHFMSVIINIVYSITISKNFSYFSHSKFLVSYSYKDIGGMKVHQSRPEPYGLSFGSDDLNLLWNPFFVFSSGWCHRMFYQSPSSSWESIFHRCCRIRWY